MKPHKWAKEIKAWADGAEIERRKASAGIDWEPFNGHWATGFDWEYRIKPQPKEPQYLYIHWRISNEEYFISDMKHTVRYDLRYIGKIKLETEDE